MTATDRQIKAKLDRCKTLASFEAKAREIFFDPEIRVVYGATLPGEASNDFVSHYNVRNVMGYILIDVWLSGRASEINGMVVA